jgi:integrase
MVPNPRADLKILMRTRAPRLTEENVARLRPPTVGERTVWCGALPRFGIRTRAGGKVKTFIVKYRGPDGRQRKMSLGSWPALSVDAARKLARQHLGDVERGRDPAAERQAHRDAPTVADLAAEHMAAKAATKRPSSLRDDRAMWDTIILPTLGKRQVKSITARDLDILHKSRQATPYRANRVLALLSNAFALGVRWSWRADNPAKGVERFHEDRRERYLKPDEMSRLVDELNGHPNRRAANAVRLLLLTGARRGEVLGATWNQFDLEMGIWTKPSAHTKQKRAHRVPLSAPARTLLLTMREESEQTEQPSPYLFPGDAPNKPLGDIKNFWRSVCKTANIQNVRIHDLRHQYASMLASAGLSLPIIGRLLGHTQAGTTARYAHLFDAPLRQATERVGALIQNAGKASAEVVPLRRGRR